MKKPIEKARLLELFDADMEAGRLFWKVYHGGRKKAGDEAGYGFMRPTSSGAHASYLYIQADGTLYYRAQLIFCLANGYFPKLTVDHIDGDGLNDRPSNLREATRAQNAQNMKRRFHRDLPVGVSRTNTSAETFVARIQCNKVMHKIGIFPTVEAAHDAYLAKRKELFGEFA